MAEQHLREDLHPGAGVETADGKTAGKLHAIILDPRDNEVTHLVVNRGPHFPEPGFGDPHLVTVDIKDLAEASEDRVLLRLTAEQFEKMPQHSDQEFFPPASLNVTTDADSTTGRVLWNTGLAIASALSSLSTGIAIPAEHVRSARYERQILNDSPVWREEPHDHIGDVERVLANEETDEVEALVIRRGVIFHEDVVLPMKHVTQVQDGIVHVRISEEELKQLQPYHPA